MTFPTPPAQNINSKVHRFNAHVVLRPKEKSINVYEFVKKSDAFKLYFQYKDTEFCDAQTVNLILQTKGIKVIVLNEEGRVLARNWI